VTASGDGTARLWDAHSGQSRGAPLRHQGHIDALAAGPDGHTWLTGSADGTARLWDTSVGSLEMYAFPDATRINDLAYSPDGKRVATCTFGSYGAQVWDVATGRPVGKRLAHPHRLWALAFSPDSKTVATAGNDAMVYLWDARTGEPAAGKPLPHRGALTGVVFSPDGKTLLTANNVENDTGHPPVRGEARLWNLGTGQRQGAPVSFTNRFQDLYSAAFSPDGTKAVVGDDGGTVWLLDLTTGRPLAAPLVPRHGSAVTAVAFSPDGKRLLTGSNDRVCVRAPAQCNPSRAGHAPRRRKRRRSIGVSGAR
jgi:WD40 repeat protein